ncbi:MAG: hypothetical protein II794_03280, partial [Oscillospiraceae bacterium]|nr:hypothetical protein [Oscillospiraceae bacterium]
EVYYCDLKVLNDLPVYRGWGPSKSKARMNVCRLAYEDLKSKGIIKEFTIRDELENPNREEAIGQLEILARRGYFSVPTYDFSLTHDRDGNPVWTAVCRIEEYPEQFKHVSSSKKEAKKTAAYKMLQFVLDREGD